MPRLFVLLSVTMAAISSAQAVECPRPGAIDEVAAAIGGAATCAAAARLARACAVGAGGDVSLAAAAERVCERSFLSRSGPKASMAYRRQRAACRRKHQDESGTMYRSFEAFCGAEIARSYARRYAARAGAQRDAPR